MVFLFSIFAQWFSRGVLLQLCLQQENRMFLCSVFWIAIALSSPIQGRMSDLTSRRRIMLFTLTTVLISLGIIAYAPQIFPKEQFSIILSVAIIINAVFGNVFPAAAAGLWDKTENNRKSLTYSMLLRYAALFMPFLLDIPQTEKFLIAICLAVSACIWTWAKVENKTILPDT